METEERKPDITLSGRKQNGEERFLYLYEYKINDTNVIFEYRFSDWIEDQVGYFELKNNSVHYNRDMPKDMDSEVGQHHRSHAYSNNEIRVAIEHFLIEKMLLVETV